MSALKNQVGGMHYKDMPIQPFQYSHANKLDAFQHTVVKYVTRHKSKGGKQDLEKAIHTLQLYMELEYPEPAVPPAATQQAREEDAEPVKSRTIIDRTRSFRCRACAHFYNPISPATGLSTCESCIRGTFAVGATDNWKPK